MKQSRSFKKLSSTNDDILSDRTETSRPSLVFWSCSAIPTLEIAIFSLSIPEEQKSLPKCSVCRVFALVEGFDNGYIIRDTVERFTGRKRVNLTLATDSRSLFSLPMELRRLPKEIIPLQRSLQRTSSSRRRNRGSSEITSSRKRTPTNGRFRECRASPNVLSSCSQSS